MKAQLQYYHSATFQDWRCCAFERLTKDYPTLGCWPLASILVFFILMKPLITVHKFCFLNIYCPRSLKSSTPFYYFDSVPCTLHKYDYICPLTVSLTLTPSHIYFRIVKRFLSQVHWSCYTLIYKVSMFSFYPRDKAQTLSIAVTASSGEALFTYPVVSPNVILFDLFQSSYQMFSEILAGISPSLFFLTESLPHTLTWITLRNYSWKICPGFQDLLFIWFLLSTLESGS